MTSWKDERLLELQNKISKCEEEILRIKHEKQMLLKKCESLKEGKESSVIIELRRCLRLSKISWSEETLEDLRNALQMAEKEESRLKKAISEMQGTEDESREDMEKWLEEWTIAVQLEKREVLAKLKILSSLGITVETKDIKFCNDV